MKPSNIVIRQGSTLSADGKTQYNYAVTFNVGNHGPFTLEFSQADFTAATVKAKLDEFAANIEQIAQPAA